MPKYKVGDKVQFNSMLTPYGVDQILMRYGVDVINPGDSIDRMIVCRDYGAINDYLVDLYIFRHSNGGLKSYPIIVKESEIEALKLGTSIGTGFILNSNAQCSPTSAFKIGENVYIIDPVVKQNIIKNAPNAVSAKIRYIGFSSGTPVYDLELSDINGNFVYKEYNVPESALAPTQRQAYLVSYEVTRNSMGDGEAKITKVNECDHSDTYINVVSPSMSFKFCRKCRKEVT